MPYWLEKQQFIGIINGVEISDRRVFMCALEIIEKFEAGFNLSVSDEFVKDLSIMISSTFDEYTNSIPIVIIENELIWSVEHAYEYYDIYFSVNDSTHTTKWFNENIQNDKYAFAPIELERS